VTAASPLTRYSALQGARSRAALLLPATPLPGTRPACCVALRHKYSMLIRELLARAAKQKQGPVHTGEITAEAAAQSCCAACKALLTRCQCVGRQKGPALSKPQMTRWTRPKKPKRKKTPKRSLYGYVKPRPPIKPSGSVSPPKPFKWD